MSSPLSTLSPDTRNHVLSFLPLIDCLRYSGVSRQSLPDILPSLKQRRDHQFGDRHVYRLGNPRRLIPLQEVPALTTTRGTTRTQEGAGVENHISTGGGTGNGVGLLVQPYTDKDQWHILPSVAERLEGLYRALPQSHRGKDIARELMLDVQGRGEEDDFENAEDTPPPLWGDHFHGAMAQLRSLVKAHKLHDLLLKESTMARFPVRSGAAAALAGRNHNMSFQVSLDQYMGDVLIAYYLMAHSIAGLVEGPSTYQKWINVLTSKAEEEGASAPVDGYRQWIYMHSTLLRMLPMKPQWLTQMRLEPICGIQGKLTSTSMQPNNPTATTTIEYMNPPVPFLAITETVDTLKVLAGPRVRQRWSNSTRFDDFGPLGPAFRGRDHVRTMLMQPGNILRHLGVFANVQRAMEEAYYQEAKNLFESWLTASETETSWMLSLSEECYRNRPMTVQAPMVTISPRWG